MTSKLYAWLSRDHREGRTPFSAVGLDFGTGNSAIRCVQAKYIPKSKKFDYNEDKIPHIRIAHDSRRLEDQKDVPSECAYHETKQPLYGRAAQHAHADYVRVSHIKKPLYLVSRQPNDPALIALRAEYQQIPYLNSMYGTGDMSGRAELWPAVDFLAWLLRQSTHDETRSSSNGLSTNFYFISVPSLFSDDAGAQGAAAYREILHFIGISPEQFDLLEEVECAAHTCFKQDAEVMHKISSAVLSGQDEVLFVDAGSGTTDMVSYRLAATSPLQLSETSSPRAVYAGPSDVIEAFQQWYTNQVRQHGLELSPDKIRKRFQFALNSFSDHFKVYGEGSGASDDFVYELTDEVNVVLSRENMKSFFNKWMNQVADMLRDDDSSSCVLLGGGSNAILMRNLVKQKFGEANVFIPNIDHSTAVADGALHAGLKPVILERIAFASVGFTVQEDYDENIHHGIPKSQIKLHDWREDGKSVRRQLVNTIRLAIVRGKQYKVGQLTGSGQCLCEQFSSKAAIDYTVPGKVYWSCSKLTPYDDDRGSFFLESFFKPRSKVETFKQNFTPGGGLLDSLPKEDEKGVIEVQWRIGCRVTQLGIEIVAQVAPNGRWDGPDARQVLVHGLQKTEIFQRKVLSLPSHEALRFSGTFPYEMVHLKDIGGMMAQIAKLHPRYLGLGAVVVRVADAPTIEFSRPSAWHDYQKVSEQPKKFHSGVCSLMIERSMHRRVSMKLGSVRALESGVNAFTRLVQSASKRKVQPVESIVARPDQCDWRKDSHFEQFLSDETLHGSHMTQGNHRFASYETVAISPGVTISMRVNEGLLGSAHFIVAGTASHWIVIPEIFRAAFEKVVLELLPEREPRCSQFMKHAKLIFSPEFLDTHKIPYNTIECNAGDVILVYSGVYYQAINQTCTITESILAVPPGWPPDWAGWTHCSGDDMDDDKSDEGRCSHADGVSEELKDEVFQVVVGGVPGDDCEE